MITENITLTTKRNVSKANSRPHLGQLSALGLKGWLQSVQEPSAMEVTSEQTALIK